MIREPAVAGTFYPSDPIEINQFIKITSKNNIKKEEVLGAIVPHAGYIYSGKVASIVFSQIKIPDTVIILAPNHTGIGASVSIWNDGKWLFPGGEIEIDSTFTNNLLNKSDYIEISPEAHKYEHSIEVELPFLYFYNKNIKIVPLVFFPFDYRYCLNIGELIADTIIESGKPALIIASSDMSHYLNADEAKQLDNLAFNAIEKLDSKELYLTVKNNNISMCGYIPATIMLAATKKLGAVKSELLIYSNSGDINNDYSSVVSYAGIIIK